MKLDGGRKARGKSRCDDGVSGAHFPARYRDFTHLKILSLSLFRTRKIPCILQDTFKTGKFTVFPFSLYFTREADLSLYGLPKFRRPASTSG
jgi:hypothetical protein